MASRNHLFVTCICLLVITAGLAPAQQVQSVRVGSGFVQPTFATSAPGEPSSMYVVQRGGLVQTLNSTTGLPGGTFINMATVTGTDLVSVGSEQGLLGMAFHPSYQNGTGFVYVSYTARPAGFDVGGVNRVDRLTVTGGTVDVGSRLNIIEIAHPTNQNHNAGWIGFNPQNGTTGTNSGHLYIGTGDGGGMNDAPNNAQNLNSLRGKLLRLDVNSTSGGNNYGIPMGNMTGTNVRQEIYSYGLRNPFQAGFDRANGNLYIGDVGQGAREEIDFIAHGSTGGQNFGWRLREGTIATPSGGVGGAPPTDNVEPIHDYNRTLGAAVIGGRVYRGPDANLQGTYFFADEVSSRIWSLRYEGQFIPTATELTSQLQMATDGSTISNPSSFAEDGFGNLYVTDYFGGEIFQIVPVPEPATVGLATFGALSAAAGVRRWTRRRAGR